MTDLERFLRDRNADADTWVDDEGLHVHDWETDRCLLFDATESDYDFICIYIHALRTLSVFGACLAEISTFDLTLTKIENDQVAVALELGYVSDNDSEYHNFKKEAIVPRKELYVIIKFIKSADKTMTEHNYYLISTDTTGLIPYSRYTRTDTLVITLIFKKNN